MTATFEFYESARSVPRFWLEVERFSGNIRAGLFEESLADIIRNGEEALRKLAA